MPPVDIKIELKVWDLKKTQAFYSAIGMDWMEEEIAIGDSGLPVRVEQNDYLNNFPHLWGKLYKTEFTFYLDRRFERMSSEVNARSVFRIHYDDKQEVDLVLERLKKIQLLAYAKGFASYDNPCVIDPDGRQVQLCFPNPFMNAD